MTKAALQKDFNEYVQATTKRIQELEDELIQARRLAEYHNSLTEEEKMERDELLNCFRDIIVDHYQAHYSDPDALAFMDKYGLWQWVDGFRDINDRITKF